MKILLKTILALLLGLILIELLVLFYQPSKNNHVSLYTLLPFLAVALAIYYFVFERKKK